mmetsp:Transcript_74835/g.178658  ORF Transcript_74835/g.178658 Transcript_74835/m.178658 type:complete len:105 (-) Transcript_74835:187-501(-)
MLLMVTTHIPNWQGCQPDNRDRANIYEQCEHHPTKILGDVPEAQEVSCCFHEYQKELLQGEEAVKVVNNWIAEGGIQMSPDVANENYDEATKGNSTTEAEQRLL